MKSVSLIFSEISVTLLRGIMVFAGVLLLGACSHTGRDLTEQIPESDKPVSLENNQKQKLRCANKAQILGRAHRAQYRDTRPWVTNAAASP